MKLLDVNVKRKQYPYRYAFELTKQVDKTKPKKIVFGTFSKAVDYAPYYIAKHNKWFEILGIEVEHKEFSTLEEIHKAFQNNELDIIFEAEPPALSSQKKGVPVKIVGISASLTQEIIAQRNLQVKTARDLKNKKIGLLKGTSSHYGVLRFLEKHNVDEKSVEINDVPPETAKARFEREKLDAWAVWPPYIEEQLLTKKANVLKGSGVYIASVIGAREDLVINNQGLLYDILKIIDKAKGWIKQNEADSQQIVSQALKVPIKAVKLSWAKHNFQINTLTNVVLADLAFSIEANKFTTILGPSGCGKSTLLKSISGLDHEYEGTIKLKGKLITGPTKECGIMFQEHRLLPWLSVKENVLFGLERKNDTAVKELLKLLDLEKFSESYPNQLSGGMAHRVALARALVNLPDLLLLDEPFTALDIVIKHNLQDKLYEMVKKENTTALMVTHDVEEAVYLSDKILVMTTRPATIIRTYDINLPRPRNRTDKKFTNLVSKIYNDLKKELKLI